MSVALDVEFARRYYRWFWKGSVGTMAWNEQYKRSQRGRALRARYKQALRDGYRQVDLTHVTWGDDPSMTMCEVCLRFKVPTILVSIDSRGPISMDREGDLVCARCLPEAETHITMLQVESLTG